LQLLWARSDWYFPGVQVKHEFPPPLVPPNPVGQSRHWVLAGVLPPPLARNFPAEQVTQKPPVEGQVLPVEHVEQDALTPVTAITKSKMVLNITNKKIF